MTGLIFLKLSDCIFYNTFEEFKHLYTAYEISSNEKMRTFLKEYATNLFNRYDTCNPFEFAQNYIKYIEQS